jgi:hypothetical protein
MKSGFMVLELVHADIWIDKYGETKMQIFQLLIVKAPDRIYIPHSALFCKL